MAETWQCEACTFLNPPLEACCTVCYTTRTVMKDQPVVWNWLAEDRWITFDLLAAAQIEAAFQAGAKEVELSAGWFQSKRGSYMIRFDVSKPGFHGIQINKHTHTKRSLRRVANDDDVWFHEVELKTLDEDSKCSVCQVEFDVQGKPVKLPCNCIKHFFHRECVAQWVKLHGTCPDCRTKL